MKDKHNIFKLKTNNTGTFEIETDEEKIKEIANSPEDYELIMKNVHQVLLYLTSWIYKYCATSEWDKLKINISRDDEMLDFIVKPTLEKVVTLREVEKENDTYRVSGTS